MYSPKRHSVLFIHTAVLLAPSPPGADSELATFYREASLLSRLHHRNIVQVGGGRRQGWSDVAGCTCTSRVALDA